MIKYARVHPTKKFLKTNILNIALVQGTSQVHDKPKCDIDSWEVHICTCWKSLKYLDILERMHILKNVRYGIS